MVLPQHFTLMGVKMKKPLVLSKGDLKVILELSEFKECLDKQKQQEKRKKLQQRRKK